MSYGKKLNGSETDFDIRPIDEHSRPLVTAFIDEHWFGTDMLIRGEVIDLTSVDGFALIENGALTGVVTYIVRGDICEITSIDSTAAERGAGTRLVEAVVARARELGCESLRLMTTNDNLNAIGFYQKRGFEIVGINLGAIDKEREEKPSIPLIGQNGIPIHHEIEFFMKL
jgi:ribosomal protein S18 acetylase RimI-like enzyme